MLTGHLSVAVSDEIEVQATGGFWSSSRQADDFENENRLLPARAVFNLGASWQAGEQLSFFVKVNNIFDRTYANYAAVEQFYPAAGRQLTLGARWEF